MPISIEGVLRRREQMASIALRQRLKAGLSLGSFVAVLRATNRLSWALTVVVPCRVCARQLWEQPAAASGQKWTLK
jgi:hypothetical protein